MKFKILTIIKTIFSGLLDHGNILLNVLFKEAC